MSSIQPGSLILVKFPFANLEEGKKRPALVLSAHSDNKRMNLITIAMVTSQIEGIRLPGDVHIRDWEKCGLLHPSLVRLAKIATIDETLLQSSIGALTKHDFELAARSFQKLFSRWL